MPPTIYLGKELHTGKTMITGKTMLQTTNTLLEILIEYLT